jgi:hypothetical protein
MFILLLWPVSWVAIAVYLYRVEKVKSHIIGVGGSFFGSCLLMAVLGVTLDIFGVGHTEAAANPLTTAEDACHDDWHRCTDNAMLINKSQVFYQAVAACKDQADQQARFGHPDFPFLAFGHFHTGNSYLTSGVMELTEPDASFQNGFGAMARMTVTCSYDMNKQAVVDMDIEQH